MAYKAYELRPGDCNSSYVRRTPGSKVSIWPTTLTPTFSPKFLRSHNSNTTKKRHWSHVWSKFLRISFAINLFSIFNFKYRLGMHFPSKNSMEQMLLKLPTLCKSTVGYTVGIICRTSSNLFASSEWGASRQQKRESRWRWTVSGNNVRVYSVMKLFRPLRWAPLPIAGLGLVTYQHYKRASRSDTNDPSLLARDWEVTCYRMVPLRAFSKAWGWVNNINLPLWARTPFLSWYATTFRCDINEAEVEDLTCYKNLGEFFRRNLKSGVRPVCQNGEVTSPADGTILHFGKVCCGRIEQVKGVSYSLATFLGPQTWKSTDKEIPSNHRDSESYCNSLLKRNEKNALYHCVVYLAPGDYHKFHSPADWTVKFRRHFAGELLSVNPAVAKWISGLFSLNERAVYIGSWKHGFFSMTAVGATNVGSIKVYGDDDLNTNNWYLKKNTYIDKEFKTPLDFKKGEAFGEFNLGSTMVLIFEAPQDFEFKIDGNGRIRVGESLQKLASASHSESANVHAQPHEGQCS